MGATVSMDKERVHRVGIFASISRLVTAYNSILTLLMGLLALSIIIIRFLSADTISCTISSVPISDSRGNIIQSIAYGCDANLTAFTVIALLSALIIIIGSILAIFFGKRLDRSTRGNIHKQLLAVGIVGIYISFMVYYGLYMLEPFIINYCFIITFLYHTVMDIVDPGYFTLPQQSAVIFGQMPWDNRTISVIATFGITGQFDILMSGLVVLWFILIFIFFKNKTSLVSEKFSKSITENQGLHKFGTYAVVVIGVFYLSFWLLASPFEGLGLQLFVIAFLLRYGARLIRPFLDPGLLRYVARRLIIIVPLFMATSIVIFLLMVAAYGNPAQGYAQTQIAKVCKTAGSQAAYQACAATVIEQVKQQFGNLYDPLQVQWLNWFFKFIMGSMGTPFSFSPNLPAVTVVLEFVQRIRPTLELSLPATVFALLLSIPLGVIASKSEYSKKDTGINIIVALGLAFPAYLGIIIGIFLFSDLFNLLPVGGRTTASCISITGSFLDSCFTSSGIASSLYALVYTKTPLHFIIAASKWDFIAHLFLPVFVITILSIGTFTLLIRSGMIETMKQDFIMSARASGFPENAITNKYALRNVLIPIVTLFGLTLAGLLAGAPITETILSWPGLGQYGLWAILDGDYNTIMATGVVIAILIMLGNLLTDILYGIIDPRIRLS